MRFLRFSPREGARFADGLARCGWELPCLHSFEFWAPRLSIDPSCTGQIGKFAGQIGDTGSFVKLDQMAHIFGNQLVPHACTRVRRSGLVV
jgi:hypothetical protein